MELCFYGRDLDVNIVWEFFLFFQIVLSYFLISIFIWLPCFCDVLYDKVIKITTALGVMKYFNLSKILSVSYFLIFSSLFLLLSRALSPTSSNCLSPLWSCPPTLPLPLTLSLSPSFFLSLSLTLSFFLAFSPLLCSPSHAHFLSLILSFSLLDSWLSFFFLSLLPFPPLPLFPCLSPSLPIPLPLSLSIIHPSITQSPFCYPALLAFPPVTRGDFDLLLLIAPWNSLHLCHFPLKIPQQCAWILIN